MSEPMNVLLVDDDTDTHRIFRTVLASQGFKLVVQSDAETALHYLEDHSPDIVVLDIMLPGIDGYQALNQIRAFSSVPVVATTAYHTLDTPHDVESRGFDGFLPKPLSTSSLLPYLKAVVSNRSG